MLLWFLEGVEALGKAALPVHGLQHAFDESTELVARGATSGPDGAAGVVVGSSADRLGYYGEQQTWRPISKGPSGRRWVGWWTDARPGPEQLRRAQVMPGHSVRLADGNDWEIPKAYDLSGGVLSAVIPRRLTRSPEGEWRYGEVLPRYRRLWELSEKIVERMAGAESGAGINVWLDEMAEVIGVNYRVGPDEVGALELLDSSGDTLPQICKAVVDATGLELLKKTT